MLPEHIGIIMDGNGRWAKQRGLPRHMGHRAGVDAFERVCEHAADLGVKYLTFYAFSTENWQRPREEVEAIMALFRRQLDEIERRRAENEHRKFRVRYIGDLREGGPVPADILCRLRQMEAESAAQDQTIINIAVNYGGRNEILAAVRRLAQSCVQGELRPEDITEADLEAGLFTAGQPMPDLIVRPSGEQRLSNFLLWQSAYAEFWFSDILWPDFTCADLDAAIEAFGKRNRRFGNA